MSKSPSFAASVKSLPFYPALSESIAKAVKQGASMKTYLDAAQKQLTDVELPKVALYVSKAMKAAKSVASAKGTKASKATKAKAAKPMKTAAKAKSAKTPKAGKAVAGSAAAKKPAKAVKKSLK
jgi:hypothetical protein